LRHVLEAIKVIARIGRTKITGQILPGAPKTTLPRDTGAYLDTPAGKKQFLDLMLREKIVLEAARRAGLDKKDDYKKLLVKFKLDQERRLKEYQEGMLMELYIRTLYDKELVSQRSGYREVLPGTTGTSSCNPTEVTARHILLSTREDAEKALARIKSGREFRRRSRRKWSNEYRVRREGRQDRPIPQGRPRAGIRAGSFQSQD